MLIEGRKADVKGKRTLVHVSPGYNGAIADNGAQARLVKDYLYKRDLRSSSLGASKARKLESFFVVSFQLRRTVQLLHYHFAT